MFATSLTSLPSDGDASLHDEIRALVEQALSDGQWARYRCDLTDALRAEIAIQIGVETVRLCSSGSMAMELALRGCHLANGDEVICPALDYPGNVRAVRLLGATPVIVDCAPDRWTIDVDQVASAGSPRTRAVVASHLYGEIAEVDRLRSICDQRGWILVEDVCQVPGGKIGVRALGSFGHVSAFSFGGSKPITSGCGGAVVTQDRRIGQRIAAHAERPSDAYAISSLQAAVLLPQWRHLQRLVKRQRDSLSTLLENCQPRTTHWSWPRLPDERAPRSYYKIPIEIASSEQGTAIEILRQHAQERLLQAGVAVGPPFRTLSKVLPGRGRLLGCQNADRQVAKNILLDHRALIGPSEQLDRLATTLIAVHDQLGSE